jgi:peptidoglycan/LPS O-acetylase OafA/YrhL
MRRGESRSRARRSSRLATWKGKKNLGRQGRRSPFANPGSSSHERDSMEGQLRPGTDGAPRRYYRPELDVLRFFAFFLVFLSHTVPGDEAFWQATPFSGTAASVIVALGAGGAFGVDLFFALSSFLITTLLHRERDAAGALDVAAFYMRRILRIWPLYFVFLLIVTPLMSYALPGESMPLKYIVAFVLLAGNWACAAWGYPHSVAGPLWTVSMEEQFYVVWPWIVQRWAANLVIVAMVLLAVSFIARVYLVTESAVHPQIWCNTLARLDPIACGALLAVIARRRKISLSGITRAVLLLIGITVFTIAGRYGDFTGVRSLITFPAVSAASVALILATLDLSILSGRTAVSRALVYLGRISYGLYVFHLTFVMLFNVAGARDPADRLIRIGAALAATIAGAAVSYQLLERRFLKRKEHFTHVPSRPV